MSQLDYYSQDPLLNLPHRQGLAGWGIAMIIMGSLAGLMALLMFGVVAASAGGLFPGASRTQYPLAIFSASVPYVIAAVALIWLGIGSRRGRRWVRPLVIVGSALTAVWGLSAIAPMISSIVFLSHNPSPIPTAPRGVPAVAELFGLACGGFFALLVMEVLPLCMLWFYARPSVQATLDQLDPYPRWTDRCPTPVLAWCFACALLGLGRIYVIFDAIFPFFTTVLVGVPATLAAMIIGVLLLVGAVLCFKMNPWGWAITLIACLIMAGSSLTFGILGDSQRVFDLTLAKISPASRQMVLASQQMVHRTMPNLWIGSVILYSLAVAYAIWLWKWFQPGAVKIAEARDGQ